MAATAAGIRPAALIDTGRVWAHLARQPQQPAPSSPGGGLSTGFAGGVDGPRLNVSLDQRTALIAGHCRACRAACMLWHARGGVCAGARAHGGKRGSIQVSPSTRLVMGSGWHGGRDPLEVRPTLVTAHCLVVRVLQTPFLFGVLSKR